MYLRCSNSFALNILEREKIFIWILSDCEIKWFLFSLLFSLKSGFRSYPTITSNFLHCILYHLLQCEVWIQDSVDGWNFPYVFSWNVCTLLVYFLISLKTSCRLEVRRVFPAIIKTRLPFFGRWDQPERHFHGRLQPQPVLAARSSSTTTSTSACAHPLGPLLKELVQLAISYIKERTAFI